MESKRQAKHQLEQATADDYDDDFDRESNSDAHDEEEKQSLNLSLNSVKSKRGRKKIEDQWSRIISISTDDLEQLNVFELAPDVLMSSKAKATLSRGKRAPEWKPLFNPDLYTKSHSDMSLTGNELTEQQLQLYGEKVTAFRKI